MVHVKRLGISGSWRLEHPLMKTYGLQPDLVHSVKCESKLVSMIFCNSLQATEVLYIIKSVFVMFYRYGEG